MTRQIFMIGVASLTLAACGGGGEGAATDEEGSGAKAELLSAGLYEVSATADAVSSTDGTDPVATLAQGDNVTTQVCVGEEGIANVALYREAEDECTAQRPYIRPGRMQVEMRCSREEAPGQINLRADGTYTEDSFEADVRTTTFLSGNGDYAMGRTITGRRVGDCPPVEEEG